MALFNKKEEKKDEIDVVEKKEDSTISVETNTISEKKISDVLLSPRITEKATDAQANNVYVFEVSPRATKRDIIDAVNTFYKVNPAKVNIVKSPAKSVWLRGRKGTKKGVKKAYIFLKEGDKIELV